MNTRTSLLLAAGLLTAALSPLSAASFSSGSNGSYGDLIVPNNTTIDLDVPPDGVFHCGALSIGSGSRVRLRPNALNTPVYFLCTTNVTINGILDANGQNNSGAVPGRGGPGGFNGGFGGFGATAPLNRGGDGLGPGRGLNENNQRAAAHATAAASNNRTYGNVLIVPMIGGSGSAGVNGNPGNGGGGGGGAILVASDTQIVINGSIEAYGGWAPNGGGSGGAVRLVSPTGGGNGSINVVGQASGGDGRIRIDTENNLAFRNLNLQGAATRGNRMFVFPANVPALHIVQAAGQNIPVGNANAVSIELPAGSPATQTVRVRGVGFSQNVQVQIVATPEHSASVSQTVELNATANPAEVEAQFDLPAGQQITIEARVL